MLMSAAAESTEFQVTFTTAVDPIAINKMHEWVLDIKNPDGSPVTVDLHTIPQRLLPRSGREVAVDDPHVVQVGLARSCDPVNVRHLALKGEVLEGVPSLGPG